MKQHARWFVIFACLCLLCCLCGCQSEPAETAQPSVTTEQTEASIPLPPQPLEIYNHARKPIDEAADLIATVSYKVVRTVNGEDYTSAYNINAAYRAVGTDTMTAHLDGAMTYGTYETKFTELYTGNTAYFQLSDTAFSSALSADDFLDRQLPAVLLSPDNYEKLMLKDAGMDTVITFSGAKGLESWVADTADVQLIQCTASATISSGGILTQTTYTADYIASAIPCHVEATVTVAPGTGEKDIPAAPQTHVAIAAYDAPRDLLQAVGHIFNAKAISSNSQELLVCAAAAVVRSYQTDINLYGSESDFLMKSDFNVSVTDYTGTVTSSTQAETFRDGVYSYIANNGEPVTEPGILASDVRTSYEDILMANLFTPQFIQQAEITDTGDFLCLRFTGNESYYAHISSGIYAILGANLDSFASSATTAEASGYLTIAKHTGLPTAIGQVLKRTHVIEGVSYDLSYEFNQSITLSSTEAYQAITGQPEPEMEPEAKATPLFYKVTGKNGETMWILGTIHAGDERTACLPQEIYDAFNASDALALELDADAFAQRVKTDPALQEKLAAGYYYTDGTKISAIVDEDVYAAAKDLMMAAGSYSSTAELLKPALWESTIQQFLLQQTHTLCVEKGLESRLTELAKQTSKPVWDVEDPVEHTLFPTRYSKKLQAFLLEGTVEASLQEYRESVTGLYELWCQGDEKELEKAIMDDVSDLTAEEIVLYGEYHKAMMTDRNAHMVKVAKQYLESGDTVFYAVGLAHVLSYDGLVNSLRDAGYTVELVTYS